MTNKQYPINEALLKDDLYQAVNGEWLQHAVIPADKPTTGGFADLADNIEKTLMADFQAMLDGKDIPDDPYLQEFIKYYRKAANFDEREALGFAPAQKFLDRILDLKDLQDWQEALPELTMSGYPTPFPMSVDPDMKDTAHYALYAEAPHLILPDKTYYTDEKKDQADQLLVIYQNMVRKLFSLAGYSADFAEDHLQRALAFDAALAPHEKDSTERADYTKMYNKYTPAEFAQTSSAIDLVAYAQRLVGTTVDQVIVTEPNYYAALNQLVTPATFAQIQSWIVVKMLIAMAPYLTDEMRVTSGEYGRALSGSKEAKKPQKAAYYLATNQFDQVVGLYYGHKYFGPQAKADVHHMVEKMVAVYKQRLENNDWLSAATRKQAVVKLNTLGINVGYPDELDPLYTKFSVDESASLLDNDHEFTKIILKDHYGRLTKPVDRTRWGMPAHMVNAYYNPSFNIIVFPAAILQAPFYSLDQPASANYGGIGAVIAHEISHAFDNNGAKFDEYGNMNNWWTDADLKHFQELAEKMIKQFDGLTTPAGKVNGKLVVSENIADAGGLSCALQAAKEDGSADLRAFFINWARIWCMKSSLERQKLLLAIDVHSPHELRANIQVKNLDDFYQTFNVQPGDGMYLPASERVNIW